MSFVSLLLNNFNICVNTRRDISSSNTPIASGEVEKFGSRRNIFHLPNDILFLARGCALRYPHAGVRPSNFSKTMKTPVFLHPSVEAIGLSRYEWLNPERYAVIYKSVFTILEYSSSGNYFDSY